MRRASFATPPRNGASQSSWSWPSARGRSRRAWRSASAPLKLADCLRPSRSTTLTALIDPLQTSV